MAGTLPSYAIFGSGQVDPGTAAKLLNDLIPPENPDDLDAQVLGAFYCPAVVPRRLSLKPVLDRLEVPEILGAGGTIPVDDVIEALLGRRRVGDEVTLVALWPDEPGEEEKQVVRRAREHGIRVVNLAGHGALDDLDWEDDEAAVPPPVPPAPGPAAVAQFTEEEVGALKLLAAAVMLIQSPPAGDAAREEPGPPAPVKAAAPPSRTDVAALVAGAEEIPEPPFDGPYSPPFKPGPGSAPGGGEVMAYYRDAKGFYRKAQGPTGRKLKARDGESEVRLTEAQLGDLVQAGQVADR